MEAPMEKKESRTGAIIGSIAAIVLCGLTGLCLLCPASIIIFTGGTTGPNSMTGLSIAQAYGILPLCLSILFIAIGVVVPIMVLRKKKPAEEATAATTPPGEPLPPAS